VSLEPEIRAAVGLVDLYGKDLLGLIDDVWAARVSGV
jgi:hypothetical protein